MELDQVTNLALDASEQVGHEFYPGSTNRKVGVYLNPHRILSTIWGVIYVETPFACFKGEAKRNQAGLVVPEKNVGGGSQIVSLFSRLPETEAAEAGRGGGQAGAVKNGGA